MSSLDGSDAANSLIQNYVAHLHEHQETFEAERAASGRK